MSENFNEKELENEKYSKNYSDNSFWDKIASFAKKVGAKGIYAALILYFVLQRDDVPTTSKAIIIGALGYFISPIDLIPDFIPFAGFTDDIGALILAIGKVSMYIDANVKEQAKNKIKDWFNLSDSEISSLLNF